MSWQLGAFAILALALAAGFAWYERARPDARIVALVGTLAAFAALGRIAFAAFPNVKPTSDIVLISGYALGGGPGFAVGAIAGLASNFFFGQGPWTPWQMAAWGVTGVVGAGLALVFRGRPIGRWPLAIVCCACGFAFTAVQDASDWITYSDHSLAQLGVYVGQGLGFDAIYAGSCLVFALAFGPALLRSIQRFTKRLEITWLPGGSSVAPALVVAIALLGAATVAGGIRTPAARAAGSGLQRPVDYLLHAQNGDGGLGAEPGQPSSSLFSGWAALGLQSAGVRLQDVDRGPGLLAYIERTAGASDAGSIERNILVARAAGLNPAAFGGHDLLTMLHAKLRGDGSIGGQVNLTAFGVLALRAAAVTVPAHTYVWLESQQDRDGGYGFAGRGAASDVDDTGAALEALASAPGSGAAGVRARAVAYIRHQQDHDGGLPSQPGEGSNSQSTAWAVQGLDAAGVDPSGLHHAGGPSPLSYLQARIGSSGAAAYAAGQDQTPVWVTGEVLMALAGKPLPLAPLPAAPKAKPTPTHTHTPARTTPTSTKPARSAASSSPSTTTSTSGSGVHGAGAGNAAPRHPAATHPARRSPKPSPAVPAAGVSAVLGAAARTAGQAVVTLRALI